MTQQDKQLPFTIAITALGGQGGGVLSTWLVEVGKASGYYAQTTSVPGVAQRTGATVYYLEFFPKSETQNKPPVMSLLPVAGNIDLVVSAELMEATRAVEKGYVTENTICIFSSHRVYSTHEKMIPGDGIVDSSALLQKVTDKSKESLYFDMEALAADYGCHISTMLLGAIAASDVLPFKRSVYEDVIRATGKAVERNLEGFSQSWKMVEQIRVNGADALTNDADYERSFSLPMEKVNCPETKSIIERISAFPEECHEYLYLGAQRLLDYQDYKYVNTYLDHMDRVLKSDQSSPSNKMNSRDLTVQMARYLSLWMGFEDTIRVAELKTRKEHLNGARQEVRAGKDQYVHLAEFMRPRVEEFCGMMPKGMATFVMNSSLLTGILKKFTGDKVYYSTKFLPYLALYLISQMKPFRRITYRYYEETQEIESWLQKVIDLADNNNGRGSSNQGNYALAIELAKCQRLIKGYGDTHARGLSKFRHLMSAVDSLKEHEGGALELSNLRNIALQETPEDNLKQAIERLTPVALAS